MSDHLKAPKFPGFDPKREPVRRVIKPEVKHSLGRRLIDKLLPNFNRSPADYTPPVTVNGFVTNRVAPAAQEQVDLTPYEPAAQQIIAKRRELEQAAPAPSPDPAEY